jgi:hypothetical protein
MESPWVGNYFGPVPIRCPGGLHFYSARDAARRLRVVVMAPRLLPEEARGRLARVHRLVEGEHVPGVVDESLAGPLPWVALDCDAVADFETLTDFVRQGAEPPPFELSSAVGRVLGEWLATPNGARHALGRRRPLRRVLLALAHARRSRAGAPVTIEELLRAGWPGEQPLAEAASNRVWVTISTLRKLGLGDALQRWDGGYRLDPAVPCRIEDSRA